MPVTLILSEVPYGRLTESSSRTSTQNSSRAAGSLITPEDLSASLQVATLNSQGNKTAETEATATSIESMRTFQVSDEVEEHSKMYYPDRNQRKDLPTIIAESNDCTAEVSGPGEVCGCWYRSFYCRDSRQDINALARL
jgi:hypothetical protein